MSGLSFDMDSLNTFVSFQFGAVGSIQRVTQGQGAVDAEDNELKPTHVVINSQGMQ